MEDIKKCRTCFQLKCVSEYNIDHRCKRTHATCRLCNKRKTKGEIVKPTLEEVREAFKSTEVVLIELDKRDVRLNDFMFRMNRNNCMATDENIMEMLNLCIDYYINFGEELNEDDYNDIFYILYSHWLKINKNRDN